MNFGTSSIRAFILIYLLIFSVVSCSKKQKSSSINLDLSSVNSSLAVGQLSQVFINVTNYEQGKEFIFNYDCEKNQGIVPNLEDHQVTFNCSDLGNVQLKLRNFTGDNLIQILMVYDGSSSSELLYGDDRRAWVLGDNELTVPFHDLASLSKEARIVGRYIPKTGYPGDGRYLTGYMKMSVDVASHAEVLDTRPPMKLGNMQMEIFGGWTQFFVLDTVGFRYHFYGIDEAGNSYNGEDLFTDLYTGTGLTMSSAGLSSDAAGNSVGSTSEVAHYNLSSQYYDERDGIFELRYFEKRIVGFFGANPDGRYLCAEQLDDTTLLDGSDHKSRVCKTVSGSDCSTYYTWGDLRSSSLAPTALNGQSDGCSDTSLEQEVDLEDVANSDGKFLGHIGPFEKDDSFEQDFFDFDPASGVLSFKIAPNVNLDEVDVYFSGDVSSFEKNDIEINGGIFDCDLLASKGFHLADSITVTGSGLYPADLSDETINPKSGVAICPLRPDYVVGGENRKYFGSSLIFDKYDVEGTGFSGSLLEMAVYRDLTTVAADFEYSGSAWDVSPKPMLMEPVAGGLSSTMYVLFRNRQNESISIDNFDVKYGMMDFMIDDSPASTPNGVTGCGSTPNLAANGNVGDECAIAVTFNSNNTFTTGNGAAHTAFNVSAHLDSDPNIVDYSGFELVANTYIPINYGDTGTFTAGQFAPAGKFDLDFYLLTNNGAGPWTPVMPATSGGYWGDYLVEHDCTTLAIGETCVMKLVLNNLNGSITTDSVLTSPHSFAGGSSVAFSSWTYTTPLSLSLGDTVDFTNISSDDYRHITITNMANVQIGFDLGGIFPADYSVSYGVHNTATHNNCNSGSEIIDGNGGGSFDGDTCEFDIDITYSSGQGQTDGYFMIPYNHAGTYRILEMELKSNHQ